MSITTSPDSQHLLINYSPNVSRFLPILILSCVLNAMRLFQEIQLWELQTLRIVSRYKDLKQSRHVIRSCFGGNDGNFVVSGSEGIFHSMSNSCNSLIVLHRCHGIRVAS